MRNNGEVSRVPEKTARFAQIVKEVGQPEVYTLWQAPDQDPVFQRAVQENRVLTVVQNPVGTSRDYALVGYHKNKNASYLIFPASLRAWENRKVIGVNYELLDEPKPVGPLVKPKPAPAKPPKKETAPNVLPRSVVAEEPRQRPPEQPPPRPKSFIVSIVVTSELKLAQEVEAPNQRAARRAAEAIVRANKPDFSKGIVKVRVGKVRPT